MCNIRAVTLVRFDLEEKAAVAIGGGLEDVAAAVLPAKRASLAPSGRGIIVASLMWWF